jgi:phage FluMu gp28-like protein
MTLSATQTTTTHKRGAGLKASGVPTIRYNRPWLYPKQLAAMFDPLDYANRPARYSMIEATTKAGKTVSALAWISEMAMASGKHGRNYWWIAPVYAQTKIAFRRLVRGFAKNWPWAVLHVDNQELTVTIFNGSTIWFKSGEKPDNLYGDDVHAAVIDEASRVREEAFHAVRSTLTATRGPLRCIGNVKGRKNWFFRMARRAEAGADNMAFYKLTAWDAVEAGVLDKAEVEDAKSVLPEAVFNELYLAIPNEDESNPFGLTHIRKCIVKDFSEERTIAAGVDLARKKNWSVVIGLDRRGAMTGLERFRMDWDQQEARILALTKNVDTLIDATGVGDVVYQRMREKHDSLDPFIFTSKSKQTLMEGLAVAIQQGEVRICGKVLIDELENFEFQHTARGGVVYSAPEGMDDDCVMALALAVERRRRTMPTAGGFGATNDDLTRISVFVTDEEGHGDGEADDEGA